jgi:hypothetical protein
MDNIPSDIYVAITKAYCKSMNCGIPGDTCLSLGKCAQCDVFERELTKIKKNERRIKYSTQ